RIGTSGEASRCVMAWLLITLRTSIVLSFLTAAIRDHFSATRRQISYFRAADFGTRRRMYACSSGSRRESPGASPWLAIASTRGDQRLWFTMCVVLEEFRLQRLRSNWRALLFSFCLPTTSHSVYPCWK